MADVRKLLATALQSTDLSDNPNEETALDRILAMAHADALGSLLWRLRLANDARSFKPAVFLLMKRMRRKAEPLPMLEKIASCAIMEWLDDLCRTCGGRGNIVPKDSPVATHACTVCEGTGRRRHTDFARGRALGLGPDVARKWEARFAMAHSRIAAADRKTWYEVAEQLERITGRAGTKEKVLELMNTHGILGSGAETHGTPVVCGHPEHNDNSIRDNVAGSAVGAQL
ncbi:MAG TPA: hypothetical protein PKV98_04300 [Burkholderiaceae bacterium]|nr:hypothetical protein [Burkholderiaceae bacterium]